jgi:hypothetical protein
VLKVRKDIRGLWSAIRYAHLYNKNVLFRISLDFIVIEVLLREESSSRV